MTITLLFLAKRVSLKVLKHFPLSKEFLKIGLQKKKLLERVPTGSN